jgi:hypothetical protein
MHALEKSSLGKSRTFGLNDPLYASLGSGIRAALEREQAVFGWRCGESAANLRSPLCSVNP